MRFLACDTETGGLDPSQHDLLTLHMKVLDENLEVLDQISVALKHPVYRVSASALKVNNIDLVKHDQVAVPVEVAGNMLINFLGTHSRAEKLLFMAHNVPFDKGFIEATFGDLMKPYLDYHTFDTVTLGVVEKILGTLGARQSLSLGKIADTLGLEKGEAHTAEGDVVTMVNYFKNFVSRYRPKIKGT